MNRRWIKYIVALLIGAAVFCAMLFGKGFMRLDTEKEKLRLLSDAFLVPGILLLLAGCFSWIMRQGTFSGMGYTVKRIFISLHSAQYREEHKESYAEYRERKAEKRSPFLFLIIVGAVYLIPAIVITILYAAL